MVAGLQGDVSNDVHDERKNAMMGTGGIAAMGVLIVLAALLCLGLLVLVGLAIVWLVRKLRTNPTSGS